MSAPPAIDIIRPMGADAIIFIIEASPSMPAAGPEASASMTFGLASGCASTSPIDDSKSKREVERVRRNISARSPGYVAAITLESMYYVRRGAVPATSLTQSVQHDTGVRRHR